VYISRDVVFDKNVFPFLPSMSVPVHTPHASSPTSIDQFADIAHAHVLLSNHGAGTGRGARLELLEEPSSLAADHVDQAGRLRCMGHAPLPIPASAPVLACTGACLLATFEVAQLLLDAPVLSHGLSSPGLPSPLSSPGTASPSPSPGLDSSPPSGGSAPSPNVSPAPATPPSASPVASDSPMADPVPDPAPRIMTRSRRGIF
jgi:hypothetical protein